MIKRILENRIILLSSTWLGCISWFVFLKITFKYFAEKSIEFYKKEYQKDLQDYNLFSLKRNEIYAQIYQLWHTWYGSLPSFSWRTNTPSFDKKDEREKRYYENCELKIIEFKNYLILNEIYLNEKVSKLSYKLFDKLRHLQHICFWKYVSENIDDSDHSEKASIDQIDVYFKLLKKEMKNDIFGQWTS